MEAGKEHTGLVLLYIIRRLLWTIPVLLAATFLAFVLTKQLPAPFENNVRLNSLVRENLKQIYGLDKPWYEQYVRYVGRFLHGDLGISTKPGAPQIFDILRDTIPTSALLGVLAFAFAMSIGTLLGVASAIWSNRWPDYGITIVSTMLFAVPSFVVCKYAVEYFPENTIGWEEWSTRIGPIVVLGLSIMPYFTRLVRASMLETLQAEFVVTARSKGLPWRTTMFRHVVRNSLIPMVINAGPLFGFVLTGSFIIEFICAIPGVASEFIRAFQPPIDANMVLGTTVMVAMAVVLANLIADLVVAWLDPRITND